MHVENVKGEILMLLRNYNVFHAILRCRWPHHIPNIVGRDN